MKTLLEFCSELISARKSSPSEYNQKKILDMFYDFSKSYYNNKAFDSGRGEVFHLISRFVDERDVIYSDALAVVVLFSKCEDIYALVCDKLEDLTLRAVFETSLCGVMNIVRNPRLGFVDKEDDGIWSKKSPFLIKRWNETSEIYSSLIRSKALHKKAHSADSGCLLVYVEDISPIRNQTGTKLVLDYLYAISKSGKFDRIVLLISNANSLMRKHGVSGFSYRCNRFDIEERIFNEYDECLSNVKVVYLPDLVPDDEIYGERSADIISAMAPNVVLFFEYRPSIFLNSLTRCFPSLYIPMQVGLPPVVLPTIEMVMAHDSRLKNETIHKSSSHVIDRQISYPLKKGFSEEAEKHGETGDHLDIITAAYDLDKRVPDARLYDFFNELSFILEEFPNSKYTMLGVSEKDGELMLERVGLSGRRSLESVNFVKNEPDFVNRLSKSDIFLMPYHKGGGRAIRTAIEQESAVFTLDNNDGNLYLAPEFVFENESAMFSSLRRVLLDDKLAECKEKCKKHYSLFDTKDLVDNTLTALFRAQECFKKKKILVLGDSHSSYFKCYDFPDHFQVFYEFVHGATLSGLHNKNSDTKAVDKFNHSFLRVEPKVTILMIGEVDIGYLAWKRRSNNSETIFHRAQKALVALNDISDTLSVSSRLIVFSIPLPVAQDGAPPSPTRENVYENLHNRTLFSRMYNNEAENIIGAKSNVVFLNLDDYVIGDDGVVKDQFLKSDTSDHHYRPLSFCSLLKSINFDSILENSCDSL